MNPHDVTWLLFATPVAVFAAGVSVYYVATRQGRDGREQGR